MDNSVESTEPQAPPATIFTTHRKTQGMVLIASLLCIALFWQGAAWLGIPPEVKEQGSLLAQPHPAQAVIATYVMLLASVVIGSIVAGRNWFFAGLFAGAMGLAALSVRGGPMKPVLFDAASHGHTQSIFLLLVAEQCILFLAVALVWTYFWKRYEAASAAAHPQETPEKPVAMIPAVLTQIIVTCILVLLLAPTDAKKQVTVGVFIAAFGGSALGEYLAPSRNAARWYWLGPFLAGVIGYAMAYSHATDWTIGMANGPLANLAHPLPLDYASAGVAGALIGYWIAAERPTVAFSWRRPEATKKELP